MYRQQGWESKESDWRKEREWREEVGEREKRGYRERLRETKGRAG